MDTLQKNTIWHDEDASFQSERLQIYIREKKTTKGHGPSLLFIALIYHSEIHILSVECVPKMQLRGSTGTMTISMEDQNS